MTIIGGKGEIGLLGSVGILNVGDGDTKLSFDPNNPQERERAARIVTEMLRLGYAIMIEVDREKQIFQRVHEFRPDTCEYVIFGDAHESRGEAGAEGPTPQGAPAGAEKPESGSAAAPAARRGRARTIIPASTVRAVGVSRSAGG